MGKRAKGGVLLLSIQRIHAERIFKGRKLYELRKLLPRGRFRRVYLYESGGSGVVGCFDTEPPIRRSIEELWSIVGEAGTPRERFARYFAGWKNGIALIVRSPVRFRLRIRPAELKRASRSFVAPLSSVFVERGTRLYQLLEGRRRSESRQVGIRLGALRRQNKAVYRELVTTEISARYDEITPEFANSALRANALGYDPNGIFTRNKKILEIRTITGRLLGFTTLTFKVGGCVKTGPTVLLPRVRGKGYGVAARTAIARHAADTGARKLYCTCPDNDYRILKHLLRAGFRVEAHLFCHYTRQHGEFVLGQMLSAPSKPRPRRIARNAGRVELLAQGAATAKSLVNFLSRGFRELWSPLSSRLIRRIVSRADTWLTEERYEEKPLWLVPFGPRRNGKRISGVFMLVPKRGGAVKGMLFSNSINRESLTKLIGQVEQEMSRRQRRKLYFVHPFFDGELIAVFQRLGYRTEGVLNEPYGAGDDAAVLSKEILTLP
jgi:predicted transcriptional regulator